MERVLQKGDIVSNGEHCYVLLEDPIENEMKNNWRVTVADSSEPGKTKRFMKYAYKNRKSACLLLKREGKFRIRHPYVERVLDFFETRLDDGSAVVCLIAEYVEGQNLRDYYRENGLRAASEGLGQKEERYAFAYMLQLLYAVDDYSSYRHEDSLVHRDLKPENIMVCEGKKYIKIVDFDWAHTDRRDRITAHFCETGGTLGYMDPITYTNMVSDLQLDIYSLAMVFCFLLTGRDYIREEELHLYLLPEGREIAYHFEPIRIPERYRGEDCIKLRHMIQSMMDIPERRYKKITDIIRDLQEFLLEYYGSETLYDQYFTFPELLQVPADMMGRRRQSLALLIQDLRDGCRRTFRLGNYQVYDIKLNRRTVLCIYNLERKLYFMPLSSGLKCLEGSDNTRRIFSEAHFKCSQGEFQIMILEEDTNERESICQ